MNTPSPEIQEYVAALLNKFNKSGLVKSFNGSKKTSAVNEQETQEKDGKDSKYSTIREGKAVKLVVNDTEADILAKMYNQINETYKKNLERLAKKDKEKVRNSIDQDLKNKEFIDSLMKSKEKDTKEEKKQTKSKGFGSLLKTIAGVGLAAGGIVFAEKAFAKLASTDFSKLIPDIKGLAEKIIPSISPPKTELFSDKDFKKAVEDYYGKKVSDEELDMLSRLVASESTTDPISQARVVATVLNRAKKGGFGGQTIKEVIESPGQFQPVTGTYDKEKKKWTGPSKQYLTPVGEERMQSISSSVKEILPSVPQTQLNFTAADTKAYKKGTNPAYREKLLKSGGEEQGGTVFNVKITPQEKLAAAKVKKQQQEAKKSNVIDKQVKPLATEDKKIVALDDTKKIDDNKYLENIKEKEKRIASIITNKVNNTNIVKNTIVQQKVEDKPVNDSPAIINKTKTN
jgi:hypothetical protein